MPPSHLLMSQECCCFHLAVPKGPCNRHYVCRGLGRRPGHGAKPSTSSQRESLNLEIVCTKSPNSASIVFPTLPWWPPQHHFPPLCAGKKLVFMVNDIKEPCNLPALSFVSIPRADTQIKSVAENICTIFSPFCLNKNHKKWKEHSHGAV